MATNKLSQTILYHHSVSKSVCLFTVAARRQMIKERKDTEYDSLIMLSKCKTCLSAVSVCVCSYAVCPRMTVFSCSLSHMDDSSLSVSE